MLRLISFYLPQYHPIPENDRWWGQGFTEWTNVQRAKPNFEGHHQPRIPSDFGYYSLLDREFQERQAKTASDFGIHAFCYYVYWFAGKRLLERPLDAMLANPNIDLEFCICWANENWTRRWDGREQDILISQPHDVANDNQFIVDMVKYIADPRYLKIDGRPVVVVYRADILGDALATTTFWRNHLIEKGLGNPYLIAVDFYNVDDPKRFGFDALAEFPPHKSFVVSNYMQQRPPLLNDQFRGTVMNYQSVRDWFLSRPLSVPTFRGVMPSWDNTARRQDTSDIFHGATVEDFEHWLLTVARQTVMRNPPDERVVFINAWNEWGEGCYLEPDARNGYRFLEAVKRVVDECRLLASCLDTSRDDLDPGTRAKIAGVIDSYERSLSGLRYFTHKNPDSLLQAVLANGFLETRQGQSLRARILGDGTSLEPKGALTIRELKALAFERLKAIELAKLVYAKLRRRLARMLGN